MTCYYISERSQEASRQRSHVASRRPLKRMRERIRRTFRHSGSATRCLFPLIHLHLVRPHLLTDTSSQRVYYTFHVTLAARFSLNVTSIRAARVTSFNSKEHLRYTFPIEQKTSLEDVKLIAAAGQTRFIVILSDLLETCAGSYM